MSFKITYDQVRVIGGSPASNSIKEYVRTGPNSAHFSGEINDVAGWFFKSTPCLQHELDGFANVVGQPAMDSYLCEIIVERKVVEEAQRRAPASNGVQWQITNNADAVLQRNLIKIADVTTGHNATIAVSHTWLMEIAHGKRTLISGASISGGFHIPAYHYVTFLRDVRRVRLKFDINWSYTVIPRGGYTIGADGSKTFTPFTQVITVLQVGARGTKREEPDFTTEPDEPYEAEPSEVGYGPHRLDFGDS